MRKLFWFFLILAIVVLGNAFAYILVEAWRPTIGGFWGGLRQSASVLFISVSDAFKTIPYWQYVGAGILVVSGYLMGHYAQVWWIRLKTWGFRKTMEPLKGLPPLQNAPVSATPQQIYPNVNIQSPPVPSEQQLKEKT